MYEPRVLAMLPDVINGKTQAELLKELNAKRDRLKAYEIKGMYFNWVMPRSAFEALLNTFKVRDDDVYAVAYPKSGNHWLNEILRYILNDGEDNFDRSFMNTGMEVVSIRGTQGEVEKDAVPGYKIMETWESPRCMATHCHTQFLPPKVWGSEAIKVIYLARNPKDTFVSMYKFLINFSLTPSICSWDAFFFSIFSGTMLGGSWFDHVIGYWEHRNDENVLFLKYESLQKDLRGCICKIAKHLEKDLSDDVIDLIAEKTTFNGMQQTYKNIEQENGPEGNRLTGHLGKAPFLRKGKVGDWKNYFTVAQSNIFDMVYKEKLEGTGLDFDFEL